MSSSNQIEQQQQTITSHFIDLSEDKYHLYDIPNIIIAITAIRRYNSGLFFKFIELVRCIDQNAYEEIEKIVHKGMGVRNIGFPKNHVLFQCSSLKININSNITRVIDQNMHLFLLVVGWETTSRQRLYNIL